MDQSNARLFELTFPGKRYTVLDANNTPVPIQGGLLEYEMEWTKENDSVRRCKIEYEQTHSALLADAQAALALMRIHLNPINNKTSNMVSTLTTAFNVPFDLANTIHKSSLSTEHKLLTAGLYKYCEFFARSIKMSVDNMLRNSSARSLWEGRLKKFVAATNSQMGGPAAVDSVPVDSVYDPYRKIMQPGNKRLTQEMAALVGLNKRERQAPDSDSDSDSSDDSDNDYN